MSMTNLSQPDKCQTCGAVRSGKFCSACGEKKLSGEDFTLKKYLLQAIDVFTHFEGKFFKSFKYLLFFPGKLTKDYIEGRRIKLMKPLQLYLIVGIAFFFLFKNWDIFFNKMRFVIYENIDPVTQLTVKKDPADVKGISRRLLDYATTKAANRHITLEEFIAKTDARLPDLSKLLIFFIIPVFSLFIYLAGFRKQRLYVPHLVHATHLFTFSLAAMTIWVGLYELLVIVFHWKMNYNLALFPVNLLFLIYIFFSLKKVLGTKNIFIQLFNTLLVGFGFIFSIFIYRVFIVWLAAWTG